MVLKLVSRHWVKVPATGFVMLLGAMMGVSIAITPLPEVTLPHILRLFTGICLFFAVAGAASGRMPKYLAGKIELPLALPALLAGITLAGAVVALTAPISVNWAVGKVPMLSATYAQFRMLLADSVHPNVMAGTLAIILPIPISLVLFRQVRTLTVWLWWMCIVVMSVVFALTLSRGGYMGIAAALLTLFIVRWPRLLFVVVPASIISFLMLLFLPSLRDVMFGLIMNDGVSASVSGRLEIWSRGWYMVQDFPFTGIGMGMHEKMIEVMYPYFINPIPLAHAHNLFLQVAVDLGIPGLIAWLGILVNVFIACIVLARSREPLLRAAGAGLLASNVALCVHGLTDAVTWGMVRTAPLVWALWGLAIGASLLCVPLKQKTEQSSAATPSPAPLSQPPPQL